MSSEDRHKAVAAILGTVHEGEREQLEKGKKYVPDEFLARSIAEAQVHATLAVADAVKDLTEALQRIHGEPRS